MTEQTPAGHGDVIDAAGLRSWSEGSYALEAAVELLLRGFGGRLARTRMPWIRYDDQRGRYWLDATRIAQQSGAMSGGEQRYLTVVAALATDSPVVLPEVVSGLDRDLVSLILAAIAHAAGTHEQSTFTFVDGVSSIHRLPSLYPWPDADK